MKKVLYGMVIAGVISGTALAGGPDMMMPTTEFKPFLGVNYSYLSVDNSTGGILTGSANSYNGIGFEAGLKYGHYLGYVLGWDHYFSETNNSTPAASIGGENYYFDVRGYYPVMSQFDLIGSVGAGIMDLAGSRAIHGNAEFGNAQTNLRLGAGADYYFTPNWGIQAMFNWSPSHCPVAADYNSWWTITAGVYYMFS